MEQLRPRKNLVVVVIKGEELIVICWEPCTLVWGFFVFLLIFVTGFFVNDFQSHE